MEQQSINLNLSDMKTEHEQYLVTDHLFRVFIRSHYKGVEISNEECDELGMEFADYLIELNLTDKQKENILPKSEANVFMNMNHPLMMNGFPAAYMLHFTQFADKAYNETNQP